MLRDSLVVFLAFFSIHHAFARDCDSRLTQLREGEVRVTLYFTQSDIHGGGIRVLVFSSSNKRRVPEAEYAFLKLPEGREVSANSNYRWAVFKNAIVTKRRGDTEGFIRLEVPSDRKLPRRLNEIPVVPIEHSEPVWDPSVGPISRHFDPDYRPETRAWGEDSGRHPRVDERRPGREEPLGPDPDPVGHYEGQEGWHRDPDSRRSEPF